MITFCIVDENLAPPDESEKIPIKMVRDHPFNLKQGGVAMVFFGVELYMFASRRSGIFFRNNFLQKLFLRHKVLSEYFSANFPSNLRTEFFFTKKSP